MTNRSGLPVARLTAEFAVIVIGVLVALFAESAWEERGERIEEREALVRIRGELAEDSIDLANDESWLRLVGTAAAAAEHVVEGRDSLSPAGRLAVLYGAVLQTTPLMPSGTWQDLTAAGRSGLVSDPDLRRLLVTWFDQREAREAQRALIPMEMRRRVLSIVPLEYADTMLNRCVRREAGFDRGSGARADAFDALLRCDVEPEDGAPRHVERILAYDDNDLLLRELRYILLTFAEELGRTRTAFDDLVAGLDEALAESS